MTITDLVARLDQRLADLDTELAELTRARDALVEVQARHAPAEPRRARRPATTTKRRSARRAPAKHRYEVVPAGKLISLLGNGEGMSTRDLARATNGDPSQVLALLKEREDAKQIRRTGTRAATRWHLITDEDRIAARAAELEASRRRTRARRN